MSRGLLGKKRKWGKDHIGNRALAMETTWKSQGEEMNKDDIETVVQDVTHLYFFQPLCEKWGRTDQMIRYDSVI